MVYNNKLVTYSVHVHNGTDVMHSGTMLLQDVTKRIHYGTML